MRALVEGLCDLGEIILAEGLHDGGGGGGQFAVFGYTLTFSLQLRKSTENLSQDNRLFGV
jgi:hypothetical protein